MKKILFTAILLVAIGCDIIYAQTDVTSPIDTWIPDNYVSSFIKNGELKCQGGRFLSGKEALYFYRPHKDQYWMLLSGNLGAVNVFLKEELDSSSLATQFLNRYLYLWLISTLGGDEWMLNKGLVYSYSKDSFGPMLQKYSSTAEPVNTGKQWKIQFYTLTISGGVELWSAEGDVFPLQISSYKRTRVLTDGTIQLPPAIR